MRSIRIFLPVLFALAAFAADKPVTSIQTVYILPMANGFDQYLANHLTSNGTLQVVTDPLKADAIFTDRIGEAFENRMDEMYADASKKKADENLDEADKMVRMTSFARGRGTLFLVDRKSRNVIWSVYELPKSYTPNELDRIADRVTKRLDKAMKTPSPKGK